MNTRILTKNIDFDWTTATKLIPPISVNYNTASHSSLSEYQSKFAEPFIRYFLPRCLELVGSEFNTVTGLPKILDLGCGFAPLAFALACAQDVVRSQRIAPAVVGIDYVGIDIREDAILFLNQAYAAHKNFLFHLHSATKTTDYVGKFKVVNNESIIAVNVDPENRTMLTSDGDECEFKLPIDFCANLQWSSSFFTHLTPQGAKTALRYIRQHISPTGLSVNSWLIIDESSIDAMKLGLADRKLNIDKNEFLTYSEENPLICTAYKIEHIEQYYASAGLEIVKIERGSWRGPSVKNSFNHYQDIIIAQPFSASLHK